MPRQSSHFVTVGGLDIVSSPLTVKPGRLWFSLNYEPVEAGYRRIRGYERIDGRPSPTDASYWMLGYTLGAGDVVATVGDTLTGGTSGATGIVLAIVAADTDYVLGELTGTFADTEALTNQSSTAVGTVSGVARESGAADVGLDRDYRHLSSNRRRGVIAAVPGAGPVRGVWVYKGVLYAVRDNAAETAGVMHAATTAGWTAVAAATLPAGGRYEFWNHNFLGQADSITMYGVQGVGRAFQWDGTTFTEIDTGLSEALDKPTHLSVHRNHLLLGYRGGSLQLSGTGKPLSFAAGDGAAELATGQDVLGLTHVGAGNTLIVGEDRMVVLYGNDSGDFQVADHSAPQTGGVEWTAQVVGAPLYLDNRGVRRFDATDAYGNFVIGTMTSDIQPFINTQRDQRNVPTASMRVRGSDQYRIFFESGVGIVVYLGRGRPELSLIDYGVKVRCTCSVEDDDRIERVYFGSDDGWVFEAEKGRSFDGRSIAAYARFPLNHVGSPTRRKRYYRAALHMDLQSQVRLSVSALFEDGSAPDQLETEQVLAGGGGLWGEAAWDEFYYDSPLNGYGSFDLMGLGRNVSILIRSETDREVPHIINGISIQWSPKGLER